jgi:hypothetical protein
MLLAAAVAVTAFGAVLFRPVRAEHFDIRITLRGRAGEARAGWDTSPPEGGVNPRQVLQAAAGEELTLEWELSSVYPHGTMRRVVIRIFVAPEAEIGQRREPPADAPRVIDNSFTADFLPHHKARGHVRFRVADRGNYLVRLESEETQKGHGHEHFAAVDLLVGSRE